MDGPNERYDARFQANAPSSTKMQRVLAVALAAEAIARLPRHVLEPNSRVTCAGYDDLHIVQVTGAEAPALILSPLVTPIFDAIDMVRFLTQSGFDGRYLALVDRLPSAALIRREVAAQAPGLSFDVVVLDGSSPLHAL